MPGLMRWDDLFGDLSRQFDALTDAEADAEQADRIRLEVGAVTLAERLAGARNSMVRLRLPGDRQVTGQLARWGVDWILLKENPHSEVVVALSAVSAVEGLTSQTGPALRAVDAAVDLRKVLRAVARDRSAVTLHTSHGAELSGTIDRVGADFLELAAHAGGEPRRAGSVRAVLVVPLAAVVMVRVLPLG